MLINILQPVFSDPAGTFSQQLLDWESHIQRCDAAMQRQNKPALSDDVKVATLRTHAPSCCQEFLKLREDASYPELRKAVVSYLSRGVVYDGFGYATGDDPMDVSALGPGKGKKGPAKGGAKGGAGAL